MVRAWQTCVCTCMRLLLGYGKLVDWGMYVIKNLKLEGKRGV